MWNHLARARGAHLNSMEVFPLFAAAMVSICECHFIIQASKRSAGRWECRQSSGPRYELNGPFVLRCSDSIFGSVHVDKRRHVGVRADRCLLLEYLYSHLGPLESWQGDCTELKFGNRKRDDPEVSDQDSLTVALFINHTWSTKYNVAGSFVYRCTDVFDPSVATQWIGPVEQVVA